MVAKEGNRSTPRRLPLSHHAKQNQQNIAAALVGWHDDATEEPKMVKNGSDEIEDD
jgi:hypothetical protein